MKGDRVVVRGVPLSHPQRVVFPAQGFTKLDLARYHDAVADWELPHLRGRALTLLRCPDGIAEKCFYQRHVMEHMPPAVRRVKVRVKGGTAEYPDGRS